jgi:ABC-type sugar transport system ATPase subunit
MHEGLRAEGLTKTYGQVTVVRDVSLDLKPGEIRAVVGENGAGKSTLMKMLAGIVAPSSGTIRIEGQPVTLNSPRAAAAAGIAIVHQELQIVPGLSVADNLMLVRPSASPDALRGSRREAIFVSGVLDRVGLRVHPHVPAGRLSVAEAQLLEIGKALALGARYIIFDEPTSALPPVEVERLLRLIGALRDEGHGILYISHHLTEILRLADCVTVLRDGRHVTDLDRAEADMERIIHLMVDRPVSLYANELEPPRDEVVFAARGAATRRVSDMSFEVRAGEILGFAGLIGSGMHEAAMAVAGADLLTAGSFALRGRPVRFSSPHAAGRAGIALVPEERKVQAIIPDMSVHDNLHVGRYRLFKRAGILDLGRLRARTAELIDAFNVRLASSAQAIATLSGGNQQKVVVARCVQSAPSLLIVAEPTRGVDVGAKDEIHRRLIRLAAGGTAIIVVSSEMDEVRALSHRIAVFSAGRMTGVLDKTEATPQRIMQMATPKEIEAAHDVPA